MGNQLVLNNILHLWIRYFDIVAFSPQKGQFATFFTDITKRRKAEIKLKIYYTKHSN